MSRLRASAPPRIKEAVPLFAALGDATRLGLLIRLSTAGPTSMAQLTETTTVSRQAINKHLDVLSDAGLVRSFRQGRNRIWELEPGRLKEAHELLDGISEAEEQPAESAQPRVES